MTDQLREAAKAALEWFAAETDGGTRRSIKTIAADLRAALSMTDTATQRAEKAEAEVARLRGLLAHWQSYGCPVCGGDCASANPPVTLCIMRETAAALKDKSHD